MLSMETLEGIMITGKSTDVTMCNFIPFLLTVKEMTKFLLSKDTTLYILSERISQDPLENYFGRQRACGGRNENPTLQQCIQNSAPLRIQSSHTLNPVRGNCRRKRLLTAEQLAIDDTPLPKRKRK